MQTLFSAAWWLIVRLNLSGIQRNTIPCSGKLLIPNMKTTSISRRQKKYEGLLDTALETAFNHVISAPTLGIKVDGHTDNWVDDWDNHVKGNKVDLFAASFGYAIESLASNIYLPGAGGDYKPVLQGVRGNTRPDVILQHKGTDVAWYDFTAEANTGHIWKKGPPYWKNQPHASELAYLSLDTNLLTAMEQNTGNKTPKNFNAKAVQEQLQRAKILSEMREKRWDKIGDKVYERWQDEKNDFGYVNNNLSPKLFKQSAMMLLLYDHFKLTFTDPIARPKENVFDTDQDVDKKEYGDAAAFRKEVPHILIALGFSGTSPYGYNGGSRNRGRSWLLQFDTGIPQMSDIIAMEENEKKKKDALSKNNYSITGTGTSKDPMIID